MTNKTLVIDLKPLPKPATQTDLLRQQAQAQMERELLETVAKRFPFPLADLETFHRNYRSLDLLLAACEYFSVRGTDLRNFPEGFVAKVRCPKCRTVVGLEREGVKDA